MEAEPLIHVLTDPKEMNDRKTEIFRGRNNYHLRLDVVNGRLISLVNVHSVFTFI